MKNLLLILAIFFAGIVSAQSSVKGTLILPQSYDRDFVARNTKVVLLTKTSRDTVSVNDKLEFNFPKAVSGTGFLYLDSPVLPKYTDYKFHIKKNKPTIVDLRYGKFEAPAKRIKTPEQREDELMAGLFIARLIVDLAVVFQHIH